MSTPLSEGEATALFFLSLLCLFVVFIAIEDSIHKLLDEIKKVAAKMEPPK